jgi:aspartate racemase
MNQRENFLRTIGLIGGMSWESSALYYQLINREVAQRRGGLRSAQICLMSLDFQDIADRQKAGDWEGMTEILCKAARRLESAGAECVLIGTNTMHKLAPQVQAAIKIPLIHIAEVTAHAIVARKMHTVGLMGTRFTMEQAFYSDKLAACGIQVVLPTEQERAEIHRIIFEELCRGEFRDASRRELVQCIESLQARCAQGIVLGCTELPLLVAQQDSALPVFDTTALHAMAAVDFSLN